MDLKIFLEEMKRIIFIKVFIILVMREIHIKAIRMAKIYGKRTINSGENVGSGHPSCADCGGVQIGAITMQINVTVPQKPGCTIPEHISQGLCFLL